jgi:hypothetical protein
MLAITSGYKLYFRRVNMIWFVLNGKRLAGLSIDGLMDGEIQATKELLAYENGVEPDAIQVEVEQ